MKTFNIILSGGLCRNCLETEVKNIEYFTSNFNFKRIAVNPKITDFPSPEDRRMLQDLFGKFPNVDVLYDEQIPELKSFNKIIPALRKYGYDNNFITFDDDIRFYSPRGQEFVNRLLSVIEKHPHNVVPMEENNTLLDHANRRWLQNKLTISQKFAKEESYAGYLSNFCYYPANSLNYQNILLENNGAKVKEIMTIDGVFKSHDEMMLSAITTLNRVKCVCDVFYYCGAWEVDVFLPELDKDRLSITEGLSSKELSDRLDVAINNAFPELYDITVQEPKKLYLNNYNVFFYPMIVKNVLTMTNESFFFDFSEVSPSLKSYADNCVANAGIKF